MQDVERSIVGGVERMGVQGTRRVECIGVGVQVKVTCHLSAGGIDRGTQGARSLLLTVRGIGNQAHGKFLADVIGSVQVGGVTFHLALFVPSRVCQRTQGGIERCLLRTRGDAHGVVLRNGVGEQQVKPVRVAHLGSLLVGVDGIGRIGQGILSGSRVIRIHELVHVAIDTAVRGAVEVGGIEPALLLHFVIHAHLVL